MSRPGIALVGILLGLAVFAPLSGQDSAQGKAYPSFSSFVSLPRNDELTRKLEAIKDYIPTASWPEVIRVLQEILDESDDCFLPLREGNKVRWASTRLEAQRLLGGLPQAGRDYYESMVGPKAAALLDRARQARDLQLVAEVARRFLHTRAGGMALDILGAHHLDRGRNSLAAACYRQLLQRPDAKSFSPLILFKAALALRLNNQAEMSAQAWKFLAASAPKGIMLQGQAILLADLKSVLDQSPPGKAADPGAGIPHGQSWMFAGDPTRQGQRTATGQLEALALILQHKAPAWEFPLADELGCKPWLKDAHQKTNLLNQAPLPAGVPLCTADSVVFRSQRGVHAVRRTTGELLWESILNGGLESLPQGALPHVSGWVQAYLQSNPHVLWENSMVGTLSTDGVHVYAVEDLAVPPYSRTPTTFGRFPANPNFSFAKELTQEVRRNRLVAMDLEGGKIVWLLGDREDDEMFFLGAPLPLEGKLFVLVEKEQELRVLAVEPASGVVVWNQALAMFKKTMPQDPARRLWAAHIAHAEGILVCPSNSGAVVAVDVTTRHLLWAHAYVPEPPPAPPGVNIRPGIRPRIVPPDFHAKWKMSAPVVAGDKVLIAAPDAPKLQCLNLRDGSLLWEVERQADDLAMAGVFDGKVLIISRDACRALYLADGKPAWTTPAGQPAGLGFAAGTKYVLPVQRSTVDGPRCLLVLDIQTGAVDQRLNYFGELLGNLLPIENGLLVQNALEVRMLTGGPK